MAMIATTMRSSIRVKILAFILDAGTEDSDSKKERGNIGIEKEEARQSGIDAAGMKLLFHKSSL